MKTVSISHLRRISRLDFELPETRGVFLLTGANGAGKSTLISCLAQIGDPGAFARFFQPNITFEDDDGALENILSESAIRFDSGAGHAVEFRFLNGKWTPDRDPLETFREFGFADTLFAGAKPKRKPVEGEIFHKKDIRPVPEEVRKAAADIFDDEDFLQLSVIRSSVTGENVFLRPQKLNGKDYFFSENNFSAGERAVIKLADSLTLLPRNSLVLIDEAEMALHPKAQKRLMLYLENAARLKNLLVIVSTQSASLIKITEPQKILFLEDDDAAGRMLCRRGVYPAAILGEMAFAEEILPETILLVEDPEAALLLEAIVSRLKSVMPGTDFPYTKILPVGGYMQVVILMDNLSKVFPAFVHRRAVLDKDAEFTVKRAAEDPRRAHHAVVSRNFDRIYFLPCAPEQGVVRLLERNPRGHSMRLRELFSVQALNLLDVMRGNADYRSVNGNSRADCKTKLSCIADYLASVSGEPEYLVRKKLYFYYVETHYQDIESLKREYCPLIFRR